MSGSRLFLTLLPPSLASSNLAPTALAPYCSWKVLSMCPPQGLFLAVLLPGIVLQMPIQFAFLLHSDLLSESSSSDENLPPFLHKIQTTLSFFTLLMKVKQESEKVGLKLNIQKMKIMASGPTTSWEIDGETVSDFISGLQNHCKW